MLQLVLIFAIILQKHKYILLKIIITLSALNTHTTITIIIKGSTLSLDLIVLTKQDGNGNAIHTYKAGGRELTK